MSRSARRCTRRPATRRVAAASRARDRARAAGAAAGRPGGTSAETSSGSVAGSCWATSWRLPSGSTTAGTRSRSGSSTARKLLGHVGERGVDQLHVGVEDDRHGPGDRLDARVRGAPVADVLEGDRLRAVAARDLDAVVARAAVDDHHLGARQVPCRRGEQGLELIGGVVRDRDEGEVVAGALGCAPVTAEWRSTSSMKRARARSRSNCSSARRRAPAASAVSCSSTSASAAAAASASPGGKSLPQLSSTISAGPAAAGATTGTPLASASASAIPNGSRSAVWSKACAVRSASAGSTVPGRSTRPARSGSRRAGGEPLDDPLAVRIDRGAREPQRLVRCAREDLERQFGPLPVDDRAEPQDAGSLGRHRREAVQVDAGRDHLDRPPQREVVAHGARVHDDGVRPPERAPQRRADRGARHEVVVARDPGRAGAAARQAGGRREGRAHAPREHERRPDRANHAADLARVAGERGAGSASGTQRRRAARAGAREARPPARRGRGTRCASSPGGQATTAGPGSPVTTSTRKRPAPPLLPL